MVFGWGKKKEEKIPEESPLQKQIKLSDVPEIISQMLDLRTSVFYLKSNLSETILNR